MKIKEIIEVTVAYSIVIVSTLIPLTLLCLAWSWCMGQVPAGEYAGLIKIGVSIALFLAGSGLTVLSTLLAMGASAAFVVWLFNK